MTMKVNLILSFGRFIGLLYYIFTITGRLCFVSYNLSSSWWLILLLDYTTDLFYAVDYLYFFLLVRKNAIRGFGDSGEKYDIPLPRSKGSVIFNVFLLIPFELIVFFGANTNYFFILRATKLLRCWNFASYWGGFSLFLDLFIPSVSGQRVVFFLLVMLFASHIGACALYAIAFYLSTKENPVYDTMLTQAALAEVAEDGSVELLHTTRYRYLRYLYFTVGLTVSVCLTSELFVINA